MTAQAEHVVTATFESFRDAVRQHFDANMNQHELYTVDISTDELWDTYLGSFPEGTNPIYRERTEHDCSCCRNFIRDMGNVVAIVDERLISIWDAQGLEHPYDTVAAKMAAKVKAEPINSVFMHYVNKVGTFANREQLDDGAVQTWSHFQVELHDAHVVPKSDRPTTVGRKNDLKQVTIRSLEELSTEACETVLELIAQGSLYRGDEFKAKLSEFLATKRLYDNLGPKKNLFAWNMKSMPIRNSVIGTLLTDLTDGVELDKAVKSYEIKVAPANYKRPTALITPSMIRKAEEKLTELNLIDSLPRRHAVVSDMSINALIWADRSVKKELSVFDEMAQNAKTTKRDFSKIEEISVEQFLDDVVPKAQTIEVMAENSHLNNLVSLLAPENPDAAPLFSWNNNFSWTYNGEVADSVKERVKAAGGSVTGLMRCSLAWYNYDDLDLHVTPPCRTKIFYGRKLTPHGQLDVDMNAGNGRTRSAVENITWPTWASLQDGRYKVEVNQYQRRETIDVGFEVELEYDGTIHTFHYAEAVSHKKTVEVAVFNFKRDKGIELIRSLPSTAAARTEWGITTQTFTPVRMILNSPNHWEKKTGNHHLFFILDHCKNPEPVRGFFNEFLDGSLNEHRKVFEVLGSKMKAPYADEQLSGLGFSSTQRNHLICRVAGAFNRTLKVLF